MLASAAAGSVLEISDDVHQLGRLCFSFLGTFLFLSQAGCTWSHHRVLFANDPGIHIYFVLDHGPGNIAGSIGQIQWVLRSDLNQFTNTYSVNTGLGERIALLRRGQATGRPALAGVDEAVGENSLQSRRCW